MVHDEATKAVMDIASVMTILGWWVEALPAIATGLTIIWTVLRIWEFGYEREWWGSKNKKKGPPEGPL